MFGRTFLALLVAIVAAAVYPSPGQWLNCLAWNGASLTKILLACLLLLAGASLPTKGLVPDRLKSMSYLKQTSIVIFVPLVVSSAIAMVVHAVCGIEFDELLLALMLFSSMPIANSTIGWATLSKASVLNSLALLVLSTILAPLIAPITIVILREILKLEIPSNINQLWGIEMSSFLMQWVLLPVFWRGRYCLLAWPEISTKACTHLAYN